RAHAPYTCCMSGPLSRFLPARSRPCPPAPRKSMLTRRMFLVTALVLSGVATLALGDDWPQWRGPDRADRSREKGLLKEWPKAGPKLLWKIDTAGIGFSGPAVVGDVLYTMGARKEEEYAIAFSVKDGSQLWATKLGPIFTYKTNRYGDGPRATPT